MQVCCALEAGALFLKILQRIAVMAILSSITPLLNSQTSKKHLELTREIFKNNILWAIDSRQPHLDTRGKSIFRYVGMARNYWKTLPSTKIGKTNFPSKNTTTRWYRYPVYLVKNDPVNIVISTRYRLLTCANRTTARRFWFRQSATKWVETLRPKWTFWRFPDFKGEKIMFPPPSPPCNVVPLFELPLENKKHPNFEWRGQGRGVDSYVLWSYPIWVQCLNNFVADCRTNDLKNFYKPVW